MCFYKVTLRYFGTFIEQSYKVTLAGVVQDSVKHKCRGCFLRFTMLYNSAKLCCVL